MSDAAGATDLAYDLRQSTGARATAERVARRYQTQRGALWYDPDFGTALTELVNASAPLSTLEQAAEAEALKDEEVADAQATATQSGTTIDLRVELATAEGPFVLTIAVNELAVELLTVGAT